jgi:hypothetical protein
MFKDGQTNAHDKERVMILLRGLTKKFAEDGASQYENFYMSFHKCNALFFMSLSHLG